MTRSPSATWLRLVVPLVCCATTVLFQVPATAEPTSVASQSLVDWDDASAFRIRPDGAQVNTVDDSDGTRGLEITTNAGASWPGVWIERVAGPWDLRDYELVEMDLHNPTDVPLNIILGVNNPGADGRNHCNKESVSVPAHGNATLVLPFGVWHGDPGHPIDQANIVSIQILLDRPTRSHRFVVRALRASQRDRGAVEEALADPYFQTLRPIYGRGVNLGNALEAPREGTWGVTLREEYFEEIAKAGFDSVRIPVRWSAHAEKAAPYTIDPAFFQRVDWAIRNSLQRRLLVVLNMHHYDEIFQEPDAHRERFLAMWEQIAERYKNLPPAVSFELLNEPHAQLDAGRWNRLAADAIALVRKTNPTRKIIVGPIGWNSINDLPSLELPEDDRNLVVTFHYYSPMRFTHQGASWVGADARNWVGTTWLGTDAERQAVTDDLDRAIVWAVKNRRPIYMGEFGAYSQADMDSRARWTRFVAEESLKRRIGFAYWEFCAGFGVYDPRQQEWIQPLKDALLPPDDEKP